MCMSGGRQNFQSRITPKLRIHILKLSECTLLVASEPLFENLDPEHSLATEPFEIFL